MPLSEEKIRVIVREEMTAATTSLREDLAQKASRADVANLRAEMESGFAETAIETTSIRSDMANEFASIRSEMGGLRLEVDGLRSEMREGFSRMDDRFSRVLDQIDGLAKLIIDERDEAVSRHAQNEREHNKLRAQDGRIVDHLVEKHGTARAELLVSDD